MNLKAPLVVAACGLVLGSCAWWEQSSQPRASSYAPKAVVCRERECRVTVTVAKCTINVEPEVIGIAKGVHDVDIVWEIRSPGVTFAREHAVFFKEEFRAAAAKQFREPRLLDDRKFRWRDANTGPGEFHYGVNVVDNGIPCKPLDPIVINDM
ncbi:MAG: hypothetical protein ACXWAC_02715 [Usitatibacter sp.]